MSQTPAPVKTQPAGDRRAANLIWRWYAGVATCLVAVAAVVPAVPRWALCVVVGAATAAVVVVGVRRHRPAWTRAWWLLAAAVVASVVGMAGVGANGYGLRLVESGMLLDGVFIVASLLVIAALASWVRPDPARPRGEELVEAGALVCVLVVCAWTFVIDPFLATDALWGKRLVSFLGYAALDLAMVTIAARQLTKAGLRAPSYLMVVCVTGVLLVGNVPYYVNLARGGPEFGHGLATTPWLVAYLLIGVAALHPSAGYSTGAVEARIPVASLPRVAIYLGMAVAGPAVIIVGLTAHDWLLDSRRLLVPLIATGGASVLLVLRLGLLARIAVRHSAAVNAQELALAAALREQEQLRRQLSQSALYDALTGLGNRALLQERLERAVGRSSTYSHGLLLFDIDGFKDANEAFGREIGDLMLAETARRLLGEVGPTDTLARLGGAQFGILLEDADEERTTAVARAALAALRRPMRVADLDMLVTTSVGVLVVAPPVAGLEALRDAEVALEAAKVAGPDQLVVHGPQLSVARHAQMQMVNGLRRAMDRDEFDLYYQPIVDLDNDGVPMVEALLRWFPPDRDPIPPAEFLPVAEQTGLITPIGAWALRRACRDARRWYRQRGASICVNVSLRQLRDPEFAGLVTLALKESGLPEQALILEVTENELVAVASAKADPVMGLLTELRTRGVRIAVDDFGAGYSSLAYLRHLPVDIIKIDHGVLPYNDTDATFTRALLDLSRSLHLQAVVETVETAEQAHQLRRFNCGLAQGFQFYRPMPAELIDEVLSAGAGLIVRGYAATHAAPGAAA